MAGLRINYGTVEECICSIRQLAADYPAAERSSVSGQGEGIAEMEQLADLYEFFYDSLEKLSEETAVYLKNVIADFRQMDEKYEKHRGQ